MEVMIDIETLNTKPDSVIATLGAVKFNRNKFCDNIKNYNTFYRRIDLKSCLDIGLTSSKDTIKWWNEQPESAKTEIFDTKNRISIQQCLKEFKEWFKPCYKIWSHGDDFDCVILKNAYDKCNIEAPWKFWNTRDTRTIFDICGYYFNQNNGTSIVHHSLQDAFRQTIALQECFKILNKSFQ